MSKGGTTSAGSATEIPQWVQDAGRKQYQTGTELGQLGYTPYYGADVAAFNPMQESAFRSTGTAADAFGMGPASTVPTGATFGAPSPTWATDGIPTAQTFAGNMRGYSGMPMYTEALNTLEEQRPYQKQQLEQQFIDPSTGLTPEGRKIQDINSLYNEAFGRNVGLEGVSTYLPLMQQGMTKNELRRLLYDSDEGKALGKSSLGAPIEIGVGGGLLGGEQYVPPALASGSSGILDSITGTGSTVADLTSGYSQEFLDTYGSLLDGDNANGLAAFSQKGLDALLAEQNTLANTIDTTTLNGSPVVTANTIGTIDTTDQIATAIAAEEAERLKQQKASLDNLYTKYLGRGIQDAGLSGYRAMLDDGSKTMAEIEADLIYIEEQGGEAALAAQRAAAQNSANLGFGATTGGQADNFVPDMPAYLGDDVVFPDGEFMGSFENGWTNLLDGGGGVMAAVGNAFSDLIGGSEKDKVDTVSAATGMSTSEVGSLIQNLAGAAGAVTAATLANTPAGRLVMDLFPDTFKSTLNTSVPVTDKSESSNDINNFAKNTADVNSAIKFSGGLTGGGL